MADHTTAGIYLDKLEALARPDLRYHDEYRRGYAAAISDVKELARRSTSGSDASLDMRAGFEKWMSDRGQAVGYQGDGLYAYRGVNEQADAFRAGVEFAVASGKASGSDGTTASVAVREGAWDWKQRAEAAEAFIKPYADANNEYLAGDYSVQPMVRRLAAAILEWQTDVLKHAPDDVCGVETEASGSELVKLKAAIDSTFPETDSAHTSVQMRRTDQRNAFRLGWEQARAAVAQQAGAPALLNADELAALRRFNETCEDGEGYDVPKEMMRRLTAIGAVEWKGFSRYQITAFGMHVLGAAPAPAAQDERDVKDAARYRWLRDVCPEFEAMASPWLYDDLDKAIDAAMSQSKTQGTADKDGAA